ncbi:hypothetical protein [Teredinibacter sp. KSP-S5-2]|uniref:hypothetical protein n=1 Tax=Teredinibacter sp. KSP-S5-2 TaxID=3034506 RepID=UPI002934DCCC|nr:hypothetical protein [Teredinibacter sp. KSP-S5-2]WNO11302.1 hypothetical protein P5V12_08970 [Teredinibacter sp. KSP-S5-2]
MKNMQSSRLKKGTQWGLIGFVIGIVGFIVGSYFSLGAESDIPIQHAVVEMSADPMGFLIGIVGFMIGGTVAVIASKKE